MTRTRITQSTLLYASDTYDDTVAPALAAFETNPINAEEDFNNIRSMVSHLRDAQAGNWYDALVAPVTLETGSIRGVQNLNDALHLVEKKRVLVDVHSLVDVTVGASNNFVILGAGELPSNTTAAVGAVTTLGTIVAAHGGTFGTHALSEVSGVNALNPKNLCAIFDGATRDPILSAGRIVWGLLQGESGVTDGVTITDTTTTRVQLSFVRVNATGDDLEAVPFADIENAVINYCNRERFRLEDLTEESFLKGAIVDTPGSSTVDRQTAYDNQGTTAVNVLTNSTLDLEAAGLTWAIRDDLEAMLFEVFEGSAGGTSEARLGAAVDIFNNDAIVNDFANELRVDTAGQRIDIGVVAGAIESTGANDLTLNGNREMFLEDGNRSGSTFAQVGVKLSETTAEWDAYEAEFGGEVSLLNAIVQASDNAQRTRVQALVTVNVAADIDVGGPGGTVTNLDVNLPPYDAVAFLTDVDVFVGGTLLRNGANAAANEDVYPGTSAALGDLRFEFPLKGTGGKPDVVTVIVWGQ